MKFNKLFNTFIPRHHVFFVKFNEIADNIHEASILLSELVKSRTTEQREELSKNIKELEHKGDSLSHYIYNELSHSFITPFEREDIYKLTSSLDDILDLINGSAQRIIYFTPKQFEIEMISLCDILVMMSVEIKEVLKEIKKYKKSATIKNNLVKINQLENNADDIFRAAISKLMNDEKDIVELIKKKEILETIEQATDNAEDVANIIFSIVMKNS